MNKRISIHKKGHFTGHINSIYTLIAGGLNHKVFSGGADGFVVEWDLNSTGDGILISRLPKPVYSLHLLKEKNQLLVGTAAGNLHIIDLVLNKEVKNIELHINGIFDIKQYGNLIFTAGADGCISVLNDQSFERIHYIKASAKSARSIAINHFTNEMAIGFSDFHIRVYDLTTFKLKKTLQAHINSVFALSYSNDGKFLLSGGRDVQLKRWDVLNDYVLINDVIAHNLHINAIAFNNMGNLFATVSMDKTIKIWDADTFALLKVIDKARNQAHASSVNKVLWLERNAFVTVSDDKNLMWWEIIES